MRIAVCVKHVPDVQSLRRLEDGTLVRGEDDVLNELDENAIEVAVSLVEENGGEVVAFSMGPEDASDALMRALQMGADRAILLSDEALAGSDVFATAKVLSAAILAEESEQPFDLVITGMASLDSMTSMLPAALGKYLGRPFLGLAKELDTDGQKVTIRRVADSFNDQLQAPLPAVVSVTDQVADPRYPNFKAMAAARKKPLDTWDLAELKEAVAAVNAKIDLSQVGMQSSGANVLSADQTPEKEPGRIVNDTGQGGKELAAYISEVLGK
ncbi:electron transfer flavoprotein subunit beta [Boudabousia tangfeifanii]|uniref:Electron transfer flavoprotein subunit beta n=1 Tax=Boudabousia tangfeifanii TaxID=1912795 RepID=A0A1D9MK21_9ACTO|nr:electron transfer flavoprotein subunit beta/FixA family protein [Boudabousia tangfeifanii]AOZ72520.1 electron transfer flavoprotein subunit beta [Boudabousia tangfeifanii]